MRKFLLVTILLATSGCGVQLSDKAISLFPELDKSTAALEQNYRVQWQAKIALNLKDGPDKTAIEEYLKIHGTALLGVAKTASELNAAVKAGQQ